MTTWYPTLRTNVWICSTQLLTMDSINLVTVNNVPVEMGRWPNLDESDKGYNTIHTATNTSITQKTGSELTIGTPPTYYVGSEVVYRAENTWICRGRITGYSGNTVTFAPKTTGQAGPKTAVGDQDDWGYFIQDDSTILDEQNEWYFNNVTHKLEMYSFGAPTNVSAASVVDLVFSSGKSHIIFDGLNFNGANQDVVHLGGSGSNDIIIRNCVIQNAGRNGIMDSVSNCTITKDSIINQLSKGIAVSPRSDHNTITYNYMRNSGQLTGLGSGNFEGGHASYSGDAIYFYVDYSVGALVEYNWIINSGYAAVQWARSDSIKTNHNYIDTFCNVMTDGGGIYTYNGGYIGGATDTTNKGRSIIGNIIRHGIGAPQGTPGSLVAGAGVAGIYNDKGSNNIIIDRNFCEKAEKGIFMNYGNRNLIVRNNTLYDNTHELQINTRNYPDNTILNYITKNICYADTTSQRCLFAYSTDDTSLISKFGSLDSNYYLRPLTYTSSSKIIHHQGGTGGSRDTSFLGWRGLIPAYDIHGIITPYVYATPAIQDTSVLVLYNNLTTSAVFSLTNKYSNIRGVAFNTGSITLLPYKSEILFRTGELDPAHRASPLPVTFDLSTPSVYPNPASESFIVALPNHYNEAFNLQLRDILGRTWDLGKQKIPSGTNHVEINIEKFNLTPGIYYLTINSSEKKIDVIKLLLK